MTVSCIEKGEALEIPSTASYLTVLREKKNLNILNLGCVKIHTT